MPLLDLDRLERNCERMRAQRGARGSLRPHLKTAKSVEVARSRPAGSDGASQCPRSRRRSYFAGLGYRDIVCATAIVPGKFTHVARICAETCAAHPRDRRHRVVQAAASFAAAHDRGFRSWSRSIAASTAAGCRHRCGHRRACARDPGLAATPVSRRHDPCRTIPTARTTRPGADRGDRARCRGHGGGDDLRRGRPCEIVSVGSTPTVLHCRIWTASPRRARHLHALGPGATLAQHVPRSTISRSRCSRR